MIQDLINRSFTKKKKTEKREGRKLPKKLFKKVSQK